MPDFRSSIQNLLTSDFYRNIAGLFSGMLVSRIIPAVFAVAIARLYAPDDFGIFVLYLTLASVLSVVATGKYENALVLVNSANEKKQLYRIAQKINTLISGASGILILGYVLLFHVQDQQRLVSLFFIPLYSFFFSSIQLVRHVFVSNKHFKKLAVLEITRALLTGLFQCLFFMFPATGLLAGAVVAQGVIYLYYSQKVEEAVFGCWSRLSEDERQLAKRYGDFPRFSVISELFNFISSQLPVFMIKPFFGATMLGLYSFSHRYISIPIQLLSTSISSVYLQKSNGLKNQPQALGELTLSLFKKQVALGIVPFAVLGLWGAGLFRFVFGAEWEFAGYLAQIISPWLMAVMVGSPLSAILITRERQKFSMNFNMVLLVVRAAALLVGGWWFKNITLAIGLYSFAGFSFFVFLTAYSLKLADVSLKKAIHFVIKVVVVTILPLGLLKLWL